MTIAALSAERARIEVQLQALALDQPEGHERFELLQTIPGVGPAVAMTLMADLPELGRIDRKAAVSAALRVAGMSGYGF